MHKDNVIGFVFVVLIVAAALATDWAIMCGIIKLITMCFGMKFKFSVATGIWLIIFVVRRAIKSAIRVHFDGEL